MSSYTQWIRKVGLFITNKQSSSTNELTNDDKFIDLSQFHIKFAVHNADVESPNHAEIRVYNLSKETVQKIRAQKDGAEFSRVILNAGYEGGNYGVIFRGTIKQFRVGRENATDSYMDILAADGDIGYNQGIIAASIAKGATPKDAISKSVEGMPETGVDFGALKQTKQNFTIPRGIVLMGMARARLRNLVTSLDAGWSIENGKVIITDNTGYRDGEAVVLNSGTGLIGLPEQIDAGITVNCLLNSRIRIGGRVKLNNEEIVQLLQQDPNAAPVPANQNTGIQAIASLSDDGMYRAFAVQHRGDTRGTEWYTTLICLAVDESAPSDKSVNPQ